MNELDGSRGALRGRRAALGAVLGLASGALAVGEIQAFHVPGGAAFRAGLYCLLGALLALDAECSALTRDGVSPPAGTVSRSLRLGLLLVWVITHGIGAALGESVSPRIQYLYLRGAAKVGGSYSGDGLLGGGTVFTTKTMRLGRGECTQKGWRLDIDDAKFADIFGGDFYVSAQTADGKPGRIHRDQAGWLLLKE